MLARNRQQAKEAKAAKEREKIKTSGGLADFLSVL